jgi:hypothetical protein
MLIRMMTGENPVLLDFVRGDATGLTIPAHPEALRTAGEAFLTDAFHRFGSLSRDNRVVRITRMDSFDGGNSGHKVLLSVEYAHSNPRLHNDLFVKFSRDFTDAFRDRRRHELEAEVRLATLSRVPAFPVQVPVAYFADFHGESGTGLLVTQRIAFGSDGIEPLRQKCMDHELADPLAYYRATVTALARLIAAHKSGVLSPEIETSFPLDTEAGIAEFPIPWNEAQLSERVTRYTEFAAQCPQLLPPPLRTSQFIAQWARDASRFLRHETAVKRFLYGNPDFIALCHWNTNIDNAWFWRDATGTLQCGLLDWGMVRQMNVAYGLWGGLCGASLNTWNTHLEELLALFIRELRAHGGPQLDITELRLHLDLSVAMLGLALMMDVPALVLSRLPEAASAYGPLDPILHKNPVARGFLHVFTNFLNLWQTHDFGHQLDDLLRR